jgi:nicotinate phosphoribosyltransferase
MPALVPPPPLVTSALGVGLDAFATVRAAVAAGIADARASFELTLRSPSDDWGFLVLAGVEPLLDALERLRPRVDELDWLLQVGAIDGPTRRRLIEARFLCDVDAAPEGSVVFPGEPVLTVEGPFWQAQLVGGMVQAAISDATAVATRFARLGLASHGVLLVEDGAATAHRLGGTPLLARAAHVGGARATTSAIAARRYRIPVAALEPARFDLAVGDVDRALRAWLVAAPEGSSVRVEPARAAHVLERLAAAVRDRKRASGASWDERHVTVELPSGDRAGLARMAVAAFAEENLEPPRIVVSGDVDERLVLSLRAEGVPLHGFVVRAEGMPGTRHVGRYELVAIESGGTWSPRLRIDEDGAPANEPGRKLLVRFLDDRGRPVADVAHVTGERLLRAQGGRYVDRVSGQNVRLDAASSSSLRVAALRAGKRANPPEAASALRDRARAALESLGERHRRIGAAARYPIGLSPQLAALRAELLANGDDR